MVAGCSRKNRVIGKPVFKPGERLAHHRVVKAPGQVA
jgi:alkylated DNA nucleotide flippase Atl1